MPFSSWILSYDIYFRGIEIAWDSAELSSIYSSIPVFLAQLHQAMLSLILYVCAWVSVCVPNFISIDSKDQKKM